MQKNSVNKAIIVGNMGQDVELKYTPSGLAVANMSVATTESRKDKSGEYNDLTEWHRIVVFGKTAEFVSKYLGKGSTVYVEGRLQTRSWEDKEGIKKYSTEIIADAVTPVGGKARSGGPSDYENRNFSGGQQSGGSAPGGSAPSGTPFGGEDDEPLPF